jgi:uncharacterized membrane protein (UPF0127 family)
MSSKWVFHVALCLYIAGCHGNVNRAPQATVETATDNGPVFTKEGELYFLSKVNNDTLRKIDIEYAVNDTERAQGLMDRKSMTDTQGMLFIFPAAQEQAFWMKNTYISLDIIYLDNHKEIVSVQKYTTPLSEESLPSFKKAQYVLEVNAGFCDKYHIAYGDKIAFTKKK